MNVGVEAPPPVSSCEKRARLADRLRRVSRNNLRCPVSSAQERLLFLDLLQPGGPLYNVPSLVRLTGPLNVAALERALRNLIARHAALRTRFERGGEVPSQVISARVEFQLRVIDAGDRVAADEWIRAEIRRPFDLSGAEALIRAALVRLDSNEHFLVLNLHHIVADEWSLNVLFREMQEFYNAELEGRDVRLPDLPIQYADYAAWQRQWLKGDSCRTQIDYWRQKLNGKPPVTEFLPDQPRGPAPAFEGSTSTRTLPADLGSRLKVLAGQKEVTLFMVLLAAFKALVHRYTGLDDIIVGTPIAGRNHIETEGLIGFFVNTLLVRSRLDGDPPFDELLQRVRSTALDGYAHQDVPFDKVVEALRPERSLDHLPFTKIMFALQTNAGRNGSFHGLNVEWLDVDTGTAKFDLTFVVQDLGDSLVARVEYNSRLFASPTIERLLHHFENLLCGAVDNPGRRLSELPLLGKEERRQLIEWNNTAAEYPRHLCVHELFEARACERPGEVAVAFGRESLTYRELNERANQLADLLASHKIAPGVPVALCMERSPLIVVAMLAILKAGGAYVPMDPNYPARRHSFMLADSRASILLTQRSLLRRMPHRGVTAICLDAGVKWTVGNPQNPPNRVAPEDTAYIIYTSGSTGQPKGVAVPHRGVTRLVVNTNYIELNPNDRIAQVSNLSFDAATFEIWGALLNGGMLCGIATNVALSPADFARELREQGITAMFVTSALFNQVAAEVPGAFSTLRTLIVGGEALDPNSVRAVLKDRPPLRLVNGYGPTENTTFTCCALVRDVPEGAMNVPIGRPISNTQVHILDAHLNPVPVGVPGELCAGGDGLACGYWNRPQLTAEKFILHQFTAESPCHRLYRTGDLARYLPDGDIEFLGRLDQQVKIRGFRVELGEIETVLGRHPGVRECAVNFSGARAGQTRLIAYFVPAAGRAPNSSQLRQFLNDQLPDYMVPSAFVELAALPLTDNGKLDRHALPAPDAQRPRSEKKFASPRDAIELELTKIWEDVLGVQPIGIEDHFFELGGHSLLAVRMVTRIEKTFGRKLRLAAIFMAPTIEQLAGVIREQTREGSVTSGTSIVELQSRGTRPPLFLVHGAGGGMFWGYVNLARRLGPRQPVFGFSSRGLDGRPEFGSIEEMAAQYVTDLRVVQPRGPYYLGGYCFGGNVAYEMARRLESLGEKVALLVLLNCAPPNSRYMRARWTPVWFARFFRNLSYWAAYCRQWTSSQRRDFLRWKWGLFKQWLAGRLGARPHDVPPADPENLIDMSSLPEQERDLWRCHIRALMKFRPQPYSGRVHLFRSPGHPLWCSFEPDYGWGEFARQGVDITVVQATHEKIMEEPWVDETAAQLKDLLERSREGDLDFWKRELAGAPVLLELPTDHPRPAVRTHSVSSETCRLPDSLAASMQGINGEILALAALNVVLQRYCGQDDLLIGIQTGGDQEQTNILPLRTSLAGNPTARELVGRVRAGRMAALHHGELSFDDLLAGLCQKPYPGRRPLVQVFFARSSVPPPEGFDLQVTLIHNESGPALRIQYATELFDRSTIQRFLGHLEMALKRMVATPEHRLSKVSILTPAEEELLLVEWNRTDRDYARDNTLIQLFLDQAARTPDAEALVCGTRRFTYSELSLRAARVAKRLGGLRVGRDALVGICLERSEDMVAGILGTLQAGAAYVPLDPAYPKARLAFIIGDAGMRVLLTRRKFRDLLSDAETPLLCVEDLDPGDHQPAPRCGALPGDLAYVLYTSGSTGQPKGVALEHRGAVALVSWAAEVFDRDEIAGVLASTSICFDLSVFEMFVPLSRGGKIILADNALALPGLRAAGEVTLINTVPSAIRELLRVRGVPSSVRVVNLAGEPLATALVDQIYRETAVKKVYDLYGPTETTTYSTFTLRQPGEPPSIGRPLSNEQVYVLDKHLLLAPIGFPGDLYIGGVGLARGYLNRPELTAERFLAHPFRPGERLYKTGDVARWRDDGNLVFLGRSDHQVKIRGFRAELGEIETVLKNHPGVADAVVIASEDNSGDKRLLAFLVASPEEPVEAEALRRVVREKLPEYMIPASFVFLPRLPLTPNGKIDRAALPVPQSITRDSGRQFVPPRDGMESQVAAIWSEVLGVKSIGASDDFFELGGHSLLAFQVISRLRTAFGVEMPLSSLFESRTVAAFASGLESGRWKPDGHAFPPLEPVPRDGMLPASFMQEQLWFLNQLEPQSDAYNIPAAVRIKGRLEMTALHKAFERILQRHEALRTTLRFSNGTVNQVVAPSLGLEIGVIDLQGGSQAQMVELLQAEARAPFDLERGPLIRARVVRLDELDHALIIVMHHAVVDGWSLDILFRELETFYQAIAAGISSPQLPSLPVQYADYAHWRRRWLHGDVLRRDLDYWKDNLKGAPLILELPADHSGTGRHGKKAARLSIELSQQLRAEVMTFGQKEGATTFMVLMAGLAITLHQWTGQMDMILGTVVAGRNRREIEGLVGCFMNFLPLRVNFAALETGLDVLRAARTAVIEGQIHQDCPFQKVVESIGVERRLGRNPFYNVALLFQNSPEMPRLGPGLECSAIDVHVDSALLDLRFEANETPTGISVVCEYKVDLFRSATIDHLLASFRSALETLVQSPGTSVTGFELKPGLASARSTTIAISGTFTTEPLEEPLRFWIDELEISAGIKFAPFNQVFQQLLDPASVLATNRHGINVVLIRLVDWESHGAASSHSGYSSFGQGIKQNAGEFVRALQAAALRGGAPILVCFCPSSEVVAADPSCSQIVTDVEDALADALAGLDGVYVATTRELAAMYPVNEIDDPASEELGNIPYSSQFFTALATLIARKFHTLLRPPCKVIALDCDQTLWSGVCGEDGPGGIRLGPPRLALQQFMRRQREGGKLLAVCSKNNDADVDAVFAKSVPMPLKRDDFSAWRVNWRPKSENLKAIAEELKLGLDSIVFIDDNPLECAEVEANCPAVLTLQLPDDPALIPQFLDHCWVFDQLKVTQEDRGRAAMYQQNRLRENLQVQAASFADFVASLELEVQIAPAAPAQWARVAQLTQRTNQFNVTGRRRTERELRQFAVRREIMAVSVRDRFGDYGLVGAMILELADRAIVVDTFLLSCRALGRGVEHRMLARLGGIALERGAEWVDVPFERLARNQPALEFLDSVGAVFKQSVGSSDLFHFPAAVAARVEFKPDRTPPGLGTDASGPAPAVRKFERCRAVALESLNLAKLQERIESRAPSRPAAKGGYAAPRDAVESQLCKLWQRLLRIDRVGVADDFFDLGGHSLLAVRLFAEVEKITGRKLPLITLFQAPTIRDLAAVLRQNQEPDSESVLVPIQSHGKKPPLYLIHGAGGDVLWGYANLVAYMDAEQPIYAFKSRGQSGSGEFQRLEDMADFYVRVLRAKQPDGPYYLGGYCFGGNVAYEMARQLRAQNHQVALLALLDSAPANAGYKSAAWWRPEFAGLFTRNLFYWLRDFQEVRPRDRRRFAARKLRALRRKLARWIDGDGGRPIVDLEEVIDPANFPASELELWKIHLRALAEHKQQPYDGCVTLFRTQGHPLLSSFAHDFRWGALAQGGVTVKMIPGSHENVFTEPHVQSLARALTAALAETQACAQTEDALTALSS